jgi:hypothetical protein
MNNLTLQINSKEALERLIGGDSQTEIDIRNSVVQKFAEKHLKAVVNSDAMRTTLYQIQTAITQNVKEQCEREVATFKTSYGGSITDIKLNPAVQKEIDTQVRTIAYDIIQKKVDESIKFWANNAEIEKIVAKKFEYYTNEIISNKVKERLDAIRKSI